MPSFLSQIFSGGVEGVFTGVGSLAKDIRSAITGEISPEAKAEIDQKLLELEFIARKTQTDINIQEAKHPNIFVSGWRPYIGWICGTSILYHFMIHPLLLWACSIYGLEIVPPVLDTKNLMTLVFSLLGLGGMRTFEKMKNVSGKH